MRCFKKQENRRTCVGCSAFIPLTRKELIWPVGLIHPDVSDAELRKCGLFGKCERGVQQQWLDWGVAIPLEPCQKDVLSPMRIDTICKNELVNNNLLMNKRIKIHSIKQYLHDMKIWWKKFYKYFNLEIDMLLMFFVTSVIPCIIALYILF